MKELLEKLTKRTEETNAALQVNAALSREGNASLKVQSKLAKAQDEKLKSLINITKAGLLGDEREKSVVKLQEDIKISREARNAAAQKETNKKSFDLREKARELQEKSIEVSKSSLTILRLNLLRDLRKSFLEKKQAKVAENRSKLLAQSIISIRSVLAQDGKTNLELLKAYKDPAERGLLYKSAAGIASLVKLTKDGETRSPTLKLIKYFKDKDKRDKIAAKERAQEGGMMGGKSDFAMYGPTKGNMKKGFNFFTSIKNLFAAIGAWWVALVPILKSAGAFLGTKALAALKFVAKRFFVIGAVVAAFDSIKNAIKAFTSTEGNFGEKFLAAIGEFSKTFLADFIGGTVNAIKLIGTSLAEAMGAEGPVLEAIKNWSAIDAVREIFDGLVNGITETITGFVGEIMEGTTMFGPDSNWFLSAIGGILGAFKGILIGVVDGIAELLGSIFTAFNFVGDADLGTMFKDFSMKDWLEGTVRPFILGIPDAIGRFFTYIGDKLIESLFAVAQAGYEFGGFMGNKLKEFVQSVLPDRKGGGIAGFIGKTLIPDGVYDWAFSGPAPAKGEVFKDTTAIIPKSNSSNSGKSLMDAGAKGGATVINVVNNNGGNVSNTTSSSQVNNTRSSSPIMMGSMGAY